MIKPDYTSYVKKTNLRSYGMWLYITVLLNYATQLHSVLQFIEKILIISLNHNIYIQSITSALVLT